MEKYKVVVYTNIFVSAFLGSKNAKLIVRDIFTGQYFLIMSHEQLQEIKTVLQRPKFNKYIHPHELDEFISLLSLKTIVPSTYGKINLLIFEHHQFLRMIILDIIQGKLTFCTVCSIHQL